MQPLQVLAHTYTDFMDIPSPPSHLETSRLWLRPIEHNDAVFLEKLYSDSQVARYIGGSNLNHDAIVHQVNVFVKVWDEHGYGQSVVVDKVTGKAIGRVGLHPWVEWNELEIGWVIATRWQRQKRATEATQAWLAWAKDYLAEEYLIAVVHSQNTASHQLAQSLGFVKARDDQTPWNPVVVWRYDLH